MHCFSLTTENHIAHLVLNQPDTLNTMGPTFWRELDEVLTTLKKLTTSGQITIVTITHKFREVNTYCDAVTVLRRGQLIGTKPTSELDNDMMAEMMVGRRETRSVVERENRAPGKAVLKLEGLSVADNVGQLAVDDLALEIRAGEIVGVAGVSGNGQRELVEVLAELVLGEALLASGALSRVTQIEARLVGPPPGLIVRVVADRFIPWRYA